jgi:hypothetical protein
VDALSLDGTGDKREMEVKCLKSPSVCDARKGFRMYQENLYE